MKTITISDKLAYILQRMIVDEINQQYEWYHQEMHDYPNNPHSEVRLHLIEQLEEDRKNLVEQGLPRFEYYY